MKLLNKLTIKNLKLNKKRIIVTVVGIVLSIALITAISSVFFSFYSSLIVSEKEQSGNFHYGFINVPANDIKYFKENRNFEEVFIIKNIGFAKLDGSENSRKPYASFMALDEKALNNMSIKLVKGRMPEGGDEILIPRHLMTSGHIDYDIGDIIDFQVGKRFFEGEKLEYYDCYNGEDEEIVDSISKRYKVVGVIERPVFSLEPYDSPGFTFISLLNDNDYGNQVDVYTRYTSKALKNEKNISAEILGVKSEFIEYLYPSNQLEYTDEEKTEFESMYDQLKYYPNKNSFLVELESSFFTEGDTKIIGYATIVLIIIIVISSIFCIRNSFNISITEKTRQYGMLSTVGATSKQIKKNIYYEALIITLISIPIGIIISLILSYLIVTLCNELAFKTLSFNLEYSFSWLSLLIAIILGFIIVFISSWQSAFTASHIRPLEAINNSEKIKVKKNSLKTPKLIKSIFGIGGIISYKNLQRSKKKYRPTIIMLVICVTIFITLSTFLQITFANISSEFKKEEYNIEISYNANEENKIEGAIHTLLESKYVRNYSITASTSLWQDNREVKFSSEYIKYFPDCKEEKTYTNEEGVEVTYNPTSGISVYKIGEYAYKKYLDSLNLSYDEMKDKGILMNYNKENVFENNQYIWKKISQYGYDIGDIFSWKTYEHDREEYSNVPNTIDIEIGYVTNKSPFGLNGEFKRTTSIILSDELYDKLFNYLDYQFTWVYIDSTNSLKFHEEIENTLVNYRYSVDNHEKDIRDKINLYTLLALFVYGFIIIISIIGLTSVINTITANMELRSREFATLRSMGMTKKEFYRMIRLESLFYGLKSLIIGIPLGIIFSYTVFYKFAMANLSSAIYQFPIKPIIIAILTVFILIMIIMKYSINKINKQNIIDTIRNENI